MTRWLDREQLDTWLRLAAMVELLPGALDAQLRRDAGLTLFEYIVLSQLSEAPERVLRMSTLAVRTNSTLPRLSHVVRRLEARGLVERFPCPEDGRATNARLTEAGWTKVVGTAPGHVQAVQYHVFDTLTREQVQQLGTAAKGILERLAPGPAKPYRAEGGPAPSAAARPGPGMPATQAAEAGPTKTGYTKPRAGRTGVDQSVGRSSTTRPGRHRTRKSAMIVQKSSRATVQDRSG